MHTAGIPAAFERLLAYSQQYQVRRWLADVSNLPLVNTDEQAWLSETWLPRFKALPIRTLALVLPINLHNQLVVEALLVEGRPQPRANVQFFSDIPAALDWLTPSALVAGRMENEWQQALPEWDNRHASRSGTPQAAMMNP
ncbi:hypothetical protein [Hymenobacter rubripertinctus]|uniref:STAS/SEC14 domain-containing protein n=1 Tax=Hymenobacter rubripertinctus TaxID=2029981 RepID=A0A418R6C0_9BACT|nr:hypothetical protein [Hymenobacter rubripertinctus]RIY12865.1 hypothetical protein D0T11_03835 [Hymenobacter rubripertinctus]